MLPLLTLQAELRTLEKHAGANEKISQQRRDLWKAESQFAGTEEAAQRRQLSAQEKFLLAHKDETLEYKRQLAALGVKVTYQERLNALGAGGYPHSSNGQNGPPLMRKAGG